jgi:adenylate cyclase class 1
MEEDEKRVFQTFPLLFHFNIPNLPGFIDQDVPAGICQFEPCDDLKQLTTNFLHIELPEQTIETREILGLYAMGSTSSVGQSSESDFDIWICHSHLIPDERLKLLNDKSWEISAWAETLGVELNFFLVPDNKFRINNHSNLSNDACGTSQHLLLLDEFYRTSLKVAGKPILWHYIPTKYDKEYDKHVKSLIDAKAINPEEWLDLGQLYEIPAEEYFGATLWQIYKGLDSPFKSILKMTLMEAYSWEYPNTQLLSTVFKNKLHSQDHYDKNLDPYCMMLDKISHYLAEINEDERLEMARRAFYLKTEEHLSKVCENDNTAWRRTILNNYINQWQWNAEKVAHFDNRYLWKANIVQHSKKQLVKSFMGSYRQLLNFARKNNISESISAKDIGILSRKLYTAYQDQPGKIELINPKISQDLSEDNLSFIQVPSSRKNKAGWYLYNCSLDKFSLMNTRIVQVRLVTGR